MVTPVEIINGTMNVTVDQIQDSTFTIIASIASLIVAMVAIIGLIKTNLDTKRSTDLYDVDLKSRLRPWVFPYDFRPTYVHLDKISIDYEEWAPNPEKYPNDPKMIRISVKLKNTGLLPANNFQFKRIVGATEIKRNQIELEPYVSGIRSIFPNEETQVMVEMDYQIFKSMEQKELWLAFMCKYDIDEETIQVVGMIGYLTQGAALRRDSWTEEIMKKPQKKSRGRR